MNSLWTVNTVHGLRDCRNKGKPIQCPILLTFSSPAELANAKAKSALAASQAVLASFGVQAENLETILPRTLCITKVIYLI